jgi:hypothetical protein
MAHLEWKSLIGHVVAVRFDAVRTTEHRHTAIATKHPVEKGADITDHVRVQLPSVTVTGYVSIAPLNSASTIGENPLVPIPSGFYLPITLPPSPGRNQARALQRGFADAAVTALFGGAASPSIVESLITTDPLARVAKMHELLTEAQAEAKEVRFVDEAKTYESMCITSVICTRTQREYGASFQIELEQLKTVSSLLVDAPVPKEARGAAPKANSASAKDGKSSEADKIKQSAALRGAKALLNGIGAGNLLSP